MGMGLVNGEWGMHDVTPTVADADRAVPIAVAVVEHDLETFVELPHVVPRSRELHCRAQFFKQTALRELARSQWLDAHLVDVVRPHGGAMLLPFSDDAMRVAHGSYQFLPDRF